MCELQLVAQFRDASAPIGLVLGLPMLGQAAPVRCLMRRYSLPLAPIAEWETYRLARNRAVIESFHSSRAIDLNRAAFEKSLAERDRGVIWGPFEVDEDLGLGLACYVIRRGIWKSTEVLLSRVAESSTTCFSASKTAPWRGPPPIGRPTLMD